jgi:hypothetical protein
MDSREINVHDGLIKYIKVHLEVYPDISVLMYIVFIDVPDAWVMLLSWKWDESLGGSLQMDLSYATIPTCENTFVRLNREQEKRYHVEYPKDHMNELVYEMEYLGNYAIFSNSLAPIKKTFKEEIFDEIWRMEFHGEDSKEGTGA